MERDCKNCVYHTEKGCSQWECKGTVTVEDVRAKVVDECIKIVESTYRMDALEKLEQLKGEN